MDSGWLYSNIGKIAQIGGFGAIIVIGLLAFFRKRKSKKLLGAPSDNKKRR